MKSENEWLYLPVSFKPWGKKGFATQIVEKIEEESEIDENVALKSATRA